MSDFFIHAQYKGHLHIDSSVRPTVGECGREIFLKGYTNALSGASQDSAIMECSRCFGSNLAQHLNGGYSAVVVQRSRAEIVLAHDELGLESLFYATRARELLISTDLFHLVDHIEADDLDELYMSDVLAHGWHLGGRTPYRAVHRLAPGTTLIWQAGELKRKTVWTLNNLPRLQHRDSRQYEVELLSILDRCVGRALPAPPKKAWCELSGGLDSTTTFAIAHGLRGGSIDACSFVYPQSVSADETYWIRAALAKYPTAWHSFDGDSLRPFSELPTSAQAEPNLSLIHAARQQQYERELSSSDVSVVLTGEGGDAAFCGDDPYPFLLADMMRSRQIWRLVSMARDLALHSSRRRPASYFLWNYALLPLANHRRGRLIESKGRPNPWLDTDFAKRTRIAERSTRTYAPFSPSIDTSAVIEQLIRGARLAAGFYQNYQASFRHPLLDREFLAFMLSVPVDVKVAPSCDRLLQRRTLEHVLPSEVLLRKFKVTPEAVVYAGLKEGHGWQDWLSNAPRIVDCGYIDRTRWTAALQRAQSGYVEDLRYFQATASIEAWLRLLEDRKRSEPLTLQ